MSVPEFRGPGIKTIGQGPRPDMVVRNGSMQGRVVSPRNSPSMPHPVAREESKQPLSLQGKGSLRTLNAPNQSVKPKDRQPLSSQGQGIAKTLSTGDKREVNSSPTMPAPTFKSTEPSRPMPASSNAILNAGQPSQVHDRKEKKPLSAQGQGREMKLPANNATRESSFPSASIPAAGPFANVTKNESERRKRVKKEREFAAKEVGSTFARTPADQIDSRIHDIASSRIPESSNGPRVSPVRSYPSRPSPSLGSFLNSLIKAVFVGVAVFALMIVLI